MAKKIIENLNVSMVIANLYHYAQELDVKEFKQFVFSQLQQLIAFRSAFWLTMPERLILADEQNCFSYKMPISYCLDNLTIISELKANLDNEANQGIAPMQSLMSHANIRISSNYWHSIKFFENNNEKTENYNILISQHIIGGITNSFQLFLLLHS